MIIASQHNFQFILCGTKLLCNNDQLCSNKCHILQLCAFALIILHSKRISTSKFLPFQSS
jgi:hypothetical protein